MRSLIALMLFTLVFANAAHADKMEDRIRAIHPIEKDFDSASAAVACAKSVAAHLFRYTIYSLWQNEKLKLVTLNNPEYKTIYQEKFSDYGAHLYFSLTYKILFETPQGQRVETTLSIPIDTTTQKRVRYDFIKKGEAIKRTTRALWTSPWQPTLVGAKVDFPSQEQLVKEARCEAFSPRISETVSEYPRCIDPAVECGDHD